MEFKTFPKPTRPSSYSNLTSFKYSTPVLQQDKDEDDLFHELTNILFECLENADNVHKAMMFHKIFLELKKESHVEDFIVEKLKHSQVKVICNFIERHMESSTYGIGEDGVKYDEQETISRGFKEELTEPEFSRKLERFKVKTIQIEGGLIKK